MSSRTRSCGSATSRRVRSIRPRAARATCSSASDLRAQPSGSSFQGSRRIPDGRYHLQRMRRVVSILRQEQGMALVMALGTMAILTAVAATLFSYTSSNSRTASYGDAKQKAYAAAEAGVNSAVAVLGLGTN